MSQIGQLSFDRCHKPRLCDNSNSTAQALVAEVANGKSDQVRRDFDVASEIELRHRIVEICLRCIIGAHLHLEAGWYQDACLIGELICWSILKRSNGSTGSVFALCEEIGHGLVVSLLRSQPADRHRCVPRRVEELDVDHIFDLVFNW